MSPSRICLEPALKVTPFENRTPKQKINFGAFVEGLDINSISDAEVEELKKTVWRHKVVVIKGQKDMLPIKQWELVVRSDPTAEQVHSHGDVKTFNAKGGMLSKSRQVFGIPGAENVRLIGKGYQGKDHYGLGEINITKGLSHDFHAKELTIERFNAGNTRFQRWHIDAPLYNRHPAWFTTLRAITLPKGPDMTINWDDGSDFSMKSKPGLTAFFSCSQLYTMLSEEEQRMADHSWVEYAPHPYMWIENCKGNPNGLGLETQGKEHTLEELGEWDSKAVKSYPMVWVNPETQEKAFMVHGIVAHKLFVRSSPNEKPRVISEVIEIREFLSNIQSRVLRPEHVLLPELEEGDMLMWDNYGVFHTACDYPEEGYGPRTMHQANIGSSVGPRGPVENEDVSSGAGY